MSCEGDQEVPFQEATEPPPAEADAMQKDEVGQETESTAKGGAAIDDHEPPVHLAA
jgi:hypothetical protein